MSVDFSRLSSLLEHEHLCFVTHAPKPNSSQWEYLLKAFAYDLQEYVRSFGMRMTNSCGIGRWAYFPWIRLYFPEMSRDNQTGIFIDYLFGWEDYEVFLTLLQGVDKTSFSELDRIKTLVQSKVDCGSFTKSIFSSPPVITGTQSKRNRAESYARGMIFQKKYSHISLPESIQLEADLKEIINIYTEVKRLEINSIWSGDSQDL